MRYLFILVAVGILAGCTHTTYLKHPDTGETVKCGPYSSVGLRDHANVQREIACVNDFQRMGYVRQSD